MACHFLDHCIGILIRYRDYSNTDLQNTIHKGYDLLRIREMVIKVFHLY